MDQRGLQPTSGSDPKAAEPTPVLTGVLAIYSEIAQFPSHKHLSRLSLWLDDWICIPGTSWRIGLDGIIGLVPGVGDTVTFLVSGVVLAAAVRHRAPVSLVLRMLGNLGVDLAVGTVPVLGDWFDFAWKANRKNLQLILRHLEAGTRK